MATRAFKYRIYPSKNQAVQLDSIFEFLRLLNNACIEERKNYYNKYKKGISYIDQANHLPEIKKMFPEETKCIHSQTIQSSVKRVDTSFSNFFRRIKNKEKPGYPRYKRYGNYRSFVFPQVSGELSRGPVILRKTGKEKAKLKLFGFKKEISVKYHRDILGTCKNVIIKKYPSGEYYVFFICIDVPTRSYPTTGKIVGIDLGIDPFATLDDGTKIRHPKPYKTSKEKLAYRQRKLNAKKKGSNNYKKQRIRVAKQHEHISNIREDFQNKLSTELLNSYDKIIIEDLNINSMLEDKGYEVNKANISDASWGSFINKMTTKALSATNKSLIKINPRNTSKTCSSCLFVKDKMELKERVFICEKCNLEIDRDINAAINIKRLGTSLANPLGFSEAASKT